MAPPGEQSRQILHESVVNIILKDLNKLGCCKDIRLV